MIDSYKNILTEKNLDLFLEGSPLINSITNIDNIFIVDFLYKEEYPSYIKITHDLSEIKNVLEKLGVFTNEINSQAKKIYNPTRVSISENYFNKLSLLKYIMHEQKSTMKVNKLSRMIINNKIDIEEIKTITSLNDNLILFTDIHIFLYALYIKYPQKFSILKRYIYHEKSITIFEESLPVDKRTLKKGILAANLEISMNQDGSKVLVNHKGKSYQQVSLKELGLLTNTLKPNTACKILIGLMRGERLKSSTSIRKQISILNKSFKKTLQIGDNVIVSHNGHYLLQIQVKQKKTTDDVLGHKNRHSRYDDEQKYDNVLIGHENAEEIRKLLENDL